MLGALGALIPELLQYSGVTSFLEARWWAVGGAKLGTNEDLNYLGVSGLRIAGGQGILIIAVCQVWAACAAHLAVTRAAPCANEGTCKSVTMDLRDSVGCMGRPGWMVWLPVLHAQVLLMFGPEYARACGIEALEPLGIYLPGDKNYPGALRGCIAGVRHSRPCSCATVS